MNFNTYQGNLDDLETDLLVFVQDEYTALYELEDGELKDRLEALREKFKEGICKREYLFDHGEYSVVVFHSKLEKGFTLGENLKTFVTRALKLAGDTGRASVTLALNSAAGGNFVEQAVEGALVGSYSFQKYKGDRKPSTQPELTLWSAEDCANAVEVGKVFGEAVNQARDLVCEGAQVLTPERFAELGLELSQRHGFTYEAWEPDRLKEEEFVGLTRVGQGSVHGPRMFTMAYEPEEAIEGVHLILLGKGVTFDTGGISIKPGEKMHLMKGDMAGAAAVYGTMEAIGRLRPKVKVTGIIVSAENSPSAEAYRPGDILVYKNGKSVHVENTDAEGRLILADGLIHSGTLEPTHIIDVATLTGACARALGPSFTGVMGSNRVLVNAITRAGGNRGESYWKLPLPAEYRELLKTPHADINNLGGPGAGAITAGLFLKEFVPAKVAWAHLDIAGTFWKQKPWKYYGEGPSGTAVKTLTDLAVNWEEHFS